jgi:hypothetical protein
MTKTIESRGGTSRFSTTEINQAPVFNGLNNHDIAELLNEHYLELVRMDCSELIREAHSRGLINGDCPIGTPQAKVLETLRASINANHKRNNK